MRRLDAGTLTADPDALREHNSRLTLRLIWESRTISRADIARRLRLSRSTVSAIVSDLLDTDLVAETGSGPAALGRPPILLEFRDEARCIVGIDLGAAHLAVVAANLRGKLRAVKRSGRDVLGDAEASAAAVLDHVAAALEAARVGRADLLGIGLSYPCPLSGPNLDQPSETIMPAWTGIDLARRLQERFQAPVFVDNDANLGALAEKWWGAGRDVDNLTYIKVATGVGAGLIIGGDIYRGSGGTAGEIGHTAIDPRGKRCRCGRNGCLEAIIGAAPLVAYARERLSRDGESAMTAQGLTPAGIARAAVEGDRLAVEIIEETAHYLGIGIANLLNLVNPAKVIIGGDITAAGPALLGPLRRAVEEKALSKSAAEALILAGNAGEDAAALGAATLVLKRALDDIGLWRRPQPAPPPARGSTPPQRQLQGMKGGSR